MNKQELIEKIASESTLSKKAVTETVNAVFEEIAHSLKKKEDVKLSGFGNFFVKEVKSHNGVNPKTKKAVVVASKKKVTFHPSEALKEKIK